MGIRIRDRTNPNEGIPVSCSSCLYLVPDCASSVMYNLIDWVQPSTQMKVLSCDYVRPTSIIYKIKGFILNLLQFEYATHGGRIKGSDGICNEWHYQHFV